MNNNYAENGYQVFRGLFSEVELRNLREVITKFHLSWKQENSDSYSKKAINSAYLTSPKFLGEPDREVLFKFVASAKVMELVTSVLGDRPAFMNTQLFFDPANKEQKNYWHRDPQYHLSLEEQKAALLGPNVVHFRVPLVDEPGLELIPGTHKRWDGDEELDVRLEQNGCNNYDNLSSGVSVALHAGDVLMFNANIIHRGLYGSNRLALDILFCDPVPELVKFADSSCLPSFEILGRLEDPNVFMRTIHIKNTSKTCMP